MVEPELGDAFGQMLLDCLKAALTPGRVFEVVERSDGLISVGDPIRYFSSPDGWSPLETLGCGFATGRVLDIGAGAGRHSLYLQDAGCSVVALDQSPLAVEVCRRRGVKNVFAGTVEDLVTTSAEPFDTFLLLGNNLGLLRDAEYAVTLLQLLGSLSAPGAVVIGHGMDPYQTEDPLHLQYHNLNRSQGRMAGQTRMRVRYRRTATEWFDYLFTSLAELESLVSRSPWRIAEAREDGAQHLVILRRA